MKNKIGDIKIVRNFAWFPTIIKGKIAWLRKYAKIYQYKKVEREWELIEKI